MSVFWVCLFFFFLIEFVVQNLRRKSTVPDGFPGKIYQTLKKKLTPILYNFLRKLKRQKYFPTHFMRPAKL